jgi:hypothetical protein
MTRFVTEAQAEEVLNAVRPWLRRQPRIDQFREQLDATVEPSWAVHCAAGHYRAVGKTLGELGPSAERAKIALQAMEESAAAREMGNYTDLLKLDAVCPVLGALDKLECALARVPSAFSGQQKPAKGPAPRNWYSRFFRDLAELASGLGIEVTIGVDSVDRTRASPFVRFGYAVEKLLPREARSNSLPACAKQMERALKASTHEIDIERAFKTYARAIRKKTRRKRKS